MLDQCRNYPTFSVCSHGPYCISQTTNCSLCVCVCVCGFAVVVVVVCFVLFCFFGFVLFWCWYLLYFTKISAKVTRVLKTIQSFVSVDHCSDLQTLIQITVTTNTGLILDTQWKLKPSIVQ